MDAARPSRVAKALRRDAKDLRLARHAGDKITYVMIGMGALEPADPFGDVGH